MKTQETLASWFEKKSRNNGDKFVSLKDGCPEWLQDAVQEAHGNLMPDDWTYEECLAACEAIDGGALEDDDDLNSHADGRVDPYASDLFMWANKHYNSDAFGEAEECSTGGTVADWLGLIQHHVIYGIASVMLRAYKESLKKDDGEEDE